MSGGERDLGAPEGNAEDDAAGNPSSSVVFWAPLSFRGLEGTGAEFPLCREGSDLNHAGHDGAAVMESNRPRLAHMGIYLFAERRRACEACYLQSIDCMARADRRLVGGLRLVG